MGTKRIHISGKFIAKPLTHASKMFLAEVLYKSKDAKIDIGEYNALIISYAPELTPDIRAALIFDVAKNEVNIDNEKFRKIGIWINEAKVKAIEIDQTKAHALMQCYNEVRNIFYQKQEKREDFVADPLPLKPSRYHDVKNCYEFLEAHKIQDWFLYFYSLCACTNWGVVWALKSCYSPKALDCYTNNKDRCKEEITRKAKAMIEEVNKIEAQKTGTQPNRWTSMYQHVEDIKTRLLKRNQAEVCYSRGDDLLLYHPQSTVCQGCPLKGSCAAKLYKYFQEVSKSTVDILQVRAGMITIPQATEQLRKEGSGFEFYA